MDLRSTEDHDLLIRVASQLEDMHNRLFGDGQQGVLKDNDLRLTTLEKALSYKVGYMAGAGAVAAFLMGVIGEVMHHLILK